jgi:hypothetical protein
VGRRPDQPRHGPRRAPLPRAPGDTTLLIDRCPAPPSGGGALTALPLFGWFVGAGLGCLLPMRSTVPRAHRGGRSMLHRGQGPRPRDPGVACRFTTMAAFLTRPDRSRGFLLSRARDNRCGMRLGRGRSVVRMRGWRCRQRAVGEFSAAGVAVPRALAIWCRARRLCGARVGSGLVAVVEGAATRRLTGRGDSLGGRTGVGGR